MSRPKIYFRADGNAQMGLGHVFRSLALANMLREEFDCLFLIRNPLPVLVEQILAVCEEYISLPEEKDELKEAQLLLREYLQAGDIIVLDGYHFQTDYQVILKDTGAKVVCIDDIHQYHFVADAVINHAPGLKPERYSLERYTQLYLGLDYSLLRPPFLQAARHSRSFDQIETAFVCFGGSDQNNLSLQALQALARQEWIKKVHVVLGGANQNRNSIEDFLKGLESPQVHIHQNLSAEQMVTIVQDSQLAIVPASSILYEAVAVNMLIISGHYVKNQTGVYEGFKKLGLIRGIGDFNTFSDYQGILDELKSEPIDPILKKQRAHFFGQSKAQFSHMFRQLLRSTQSGMSHRQARAADLMLYFEWANDPAVRRQSLSQASISLEDHSRWFHSKLASKSSRLFLFFAGQQPIGQVRFELDEAQAVINYSLAAPARGQGFGKKMLSIAMDALAEEPDLHIEAFFGIVKKENTPSKKIFERLGFELTEEKLIREVPCFVYTKQVEGRR
jgi:UDP-2,4-diacetamido-2,4,6-trideoxy-beta-L-altropyranose hydrolase